MLKEIINFSNEKNAIKFNALSVFVSDFTYSSLIILMKFIEFIWEIYKRIISITCVYLINL